MPFDSIKMKNVFTPTNQLKTNSKIYLETKALYNIVKNDGMTAFAQRMPAAGIPAQRLSPVQSLNLPHMNQEVVSR